MEAKARRQKRESFFVCFFKTGSLCCNNPDHARPHFVDQADLALRDSPNCTLCLMSFQSEAVCTQDHQDQVQESLALAF